MDQDKRESILSCASEQFTRFGFKKTSIDDIAKCAGVAKGTVYLAAKSKKELFYEVLLREIRDWAADEQKLIDPREDADLTLVKMSIQGLTSLDQRPLIKSLLTGAYDEMLPELRTRWNELRTVCTSHVVELLNLGKRQGVFRADLDAEHAAIMLLDLQVAVLLFHLQGDDAFAKVVERGHTVFSILLNGMRQDPSRPLPDVLGALPDLSG